MIVTFDLCHIDVNEKIEFFMDASDQSTRGGGWLQAESGEGRGESASDITPPFELDDFYGVRDGVVLACDGQLALDDETGVSDVAPERFDIEGRMKNTPASNNDVIRGISANRARLRTNWPRGMPAASQSRRRPS